MSGWKTIPLGDFAESVDYGVTASATEQPIGPKFLRITDIQDGAVNWDSVPWCECDTRSVSDARLKAGDIVFARTGATTGKSFLIRDCPTDAVFASYLIRVRVGDAAEPRFVSHFFQTENYWAQVAKGARGVAQPGVNATTLKALEIPLPPLEEQKRIAAILDQADALRAKRRAALAQLDTLTQSIFLDMFGDPATNPKGWPKTTLGKIIEFVGGSQPPRDTFTYEPSNDTIRLVQIRDFKSDGFKTYIPRKLARRFFDEDDVMIGRYGPPVFQILRGLSGSYNVALMKALPRDEVSKDFIFYLLQEPRLHSYVVARSERTAGQTGVNLELLENYPAYLPPVDIQLKFTAQASTVEALKTAHRASLSQLDALFASLQHRAFRGEL